MLRVVDVDDVLVRVRAMKVHGFALGGANDDRFVIRSRNRKRRPPLEGVRAARKRQGVRVVVYQCAFVAMYR